MLIVAGVLSLLIWGYLLVLRGGFWRIRHAIPPGFQEPDFQKKGKLEPENPVRVAVIVPARNEADVVGRAIRSLLHQASRNSIHIFLVDDSSTDSTAQVARDAAAAAARAEEVTVVAGSPLPDGWSGKLWAMQQGVELARAVATQPDFFLFTDA